MSISPKNEFLKNLQNLSKTEQATVQKFESDPTGASFVPVAEILRSRGYLEEAIVMLEDGLLKYPLYSSARASLAKDYYSLGMLQEALEQAQKVLEQGPDNAMAQRICLKLQVLFNKREEVLSRLKTIEKIVQDDEITEAIRKSIAAGDWAAAQKWVRSELERSGINTALYGNPSEPSTSEPVAFLQSSEDNVARSTTSASKLETGATHARHGWSLPGARTEQPEMQYRRGAQANAQVSAAENVSRSIDLKIPSEEHLPEALQSGSSLAHVKGDIDRYLLLKGFRSVAIGGFLLGKQENLTAIQNNVETRTIAEIYKSQGLYLKALEAYESLIREDPRNASYQAEYEELKQLMKKEYFAGESDARKAQAQQDEDKEIESSKKKINTLRKILGRLDKGTADGA